MSDQENDPAIIAPPRTDTPDWSTRWSPILMMGYVVVFLGATITMIITGHDDAAIIFGLATIYTLTAAIG